MDKVPLLIGKLEKRSDLSNVGELVRVRQGILMCVCTCVSACACACAQTDNVILMTLSLSYISHVSVICFSSSSFFFQILDAAV